MFFIVAERFAVSIRIIITDLVRRGYKKVLLF